MRLPHVPRILPFLNFVKLILILILVVMFVQFNARIAQQQQQVKQIAQSTNGVVKGQANILNAIKEVTDDTHVTAAQQTAIIICMLQVPVENRTTDLQSQCRAQANSTVSDSASGTTPGSTGTNHETSSSNTTTNNESSQSNTSQNPDPTPQPAKILGIPVCVPFTKMCVLN